MASLFERIGKEVEKRGPDMLRISLGVIFFWFGFLKYFGNTSPAEEIGGRTIRFLTFDLLSQDAALIFLATFECLLGIGMIIKPLMRYAVPVLYFHLAGTLLPLFVFIHDTWKICPIVPTLLGQYILKNAILISAAIILNAISKGGKLITDPHIAHKAKKAQKRKEQTE